MITRIVKMEIKENDVAQYMYHVKPFIEKILEFPGCKEVKIYRDINSETTFFSYSIWESEHDLNNYRHSEIFIETWQKIKPLFCSKPMAWSLEKKI